MVAIAPLRPLRPLAHPQPSALRPRRNPQAALAAGALNAAAAADLKWSIARAWTVALPGEVLVVFALGVISLFAHGLNMFNNPGFSRFGDEGIYNAQAWAVLRQGALAPYTYFYDHAPGGWLILAAWMWFTGGVSSFGSALDSGRMLMLLLHLATVPVLYRLARKLGSNPPAASLVVLLFSLSPLAVYYQRLAVLDTFMIFWLLVSLDLLLNGWGRLSRLALSGVCFGFALLCKESALFFVPGMLFISWQDRWRHQGRFAIVGWLVPMAITVSLYPLYALFKGELLPSGLVVDLFFFRLGDLFEHVSLIDTLKWQASRDGGGMLNLQNKFWTNVQWEWLPRDPLLFIGGAAAIGLNLLRGLLGQRRAVAAGLLGAGMLYYLARGGIVYDFYVIGIIPIFCLNLGLLVSPFLHRLPARAAGPVVVAAVLALLAFYVKTDRIQHLYVERPADSARDSIEWIRRNLPSDVRMIVHDSAWTDLHEPARGNPIFPFAHPHWKVASDPDIRDGVFLGDWRNVEYLLINYDVPDYLEQTNNVVAKEALRHAHLVKSWQGGSPGYSKWDRVELWKVDTSGRTERALLSGTAALLGRYDRAGAITGPDGVVSSQSQALAMQRAVWSDDRAAFDRVWSWTRANLRRSDGLLAGVWKSGVVADNRSSAEADTNVALALILAGGRWGDAALLDEGRRMASTIWEQYVVPVNGHPVIVAGDWAKGPDTLAVSSGSLSPHAYYAFAKFDSEHPWQQLIEISYEALFWATSPRAAPGARGVGLPADWIGIDRSSEKFTPLTVPNVDTTRFGPDAAHAFFSAALHASWSASDGSADPTALRFLQQSRFLREQLERNGAVAPAYSRGGQPLDAAPVTASAAGLTAALSVQDRALAHRVFSSQILGRSSRQGSAVIWGSPADLASQEWGWLATALMTGRLTLF
jgi:hypothetical protein